MKVPFSRLNPRHARSVGLILLEKSELHSADNSFLGKYRNELSVGIGNLNDSLAKASTEELAEIAEGRDKSFDSRFYKLCKTINFKAGDEDFGAEGESSAVLANDIAAFGGRIERLPREQQINAMDQIIERWSSDDRQEHISRAGVRKLYNNTVANHLELKQIENERALAEVELSSVLPLWTARDAVIPSIRAIFTHISDYARINSETYGLTLAEIEAELKPIIKQVHAEKTRKSSK